MTIAWTRQSVTYVGKTCAQVLLCPIAKPMGLTDGWSVTIKEIIKSRMTLKLLGRVMLDKEDKEDW